MKAKIKRVKFDESVSEKDWLELKQSEGFTDLLTESTGRDNIPSGEDCHSLPDFSSDSVADNVFLNLLPGLFKNLGFRFELKGKTGLVIGSRGCIGSKVMLRGMGFGMDMIGFDIWEINATEEKLLRMFGWVDLIFICIPLNSKTENYFCAKYFEAMKNSPLIINVSGRNEFLDPNLLGHYLLSDWIKGYACDGFIAHWIKDLPQTFFCKHSGARSIEADERKELVLKEKLKEIVENRRCKE